MSSDPPELDLCVKGSLPSQPPPPATPPRHYRPPLMPSNPLDTAPSSPSQIYLNLLILEASLRSQYLTHLGRRRKFTFFLVVLFLWVAFFGYRFFVLGGSPYYYISHFEKLGLGGGVVTGILYYVTGTYRSTIVEPRQFVSSANKGLRGFNVKLVKIPLTYREWLTWWWGWYTLKPPPQPHPPPRPHGRRPSSNTRRPTPPIPSHTYAPSISVTTLKPPLPPAPHSPSTDDDDDDDDFVEDFLPGGLHLKLVILPKGFSPDFREGWELYRSEYWEKENERRRLLLLMPRGVDASPVPSPEKRMRGASFTRTPTPDLVPTSARTRRGSTASLKRRSATGLPMTPAGEISDSGSSVVGMERSASSVGMERVGSVGGVGSIGRKAGRGRGKKKGPSTGVGEEA